MTVTPAKILTAIAAVLFLLAALGVSLGAIGLVELGLFFFALAFLI